MWTFLPDHRAVIRTRGLIGRVTYSSVHFTKVMSKRITIIQGHPDPRSRHFGNALAKAYGDSARAAGHEVKCIEVAKLAFPLLRSAEDFYLGTTPQDIAVAQNAIRWADHLLIVYPLWHGHFPALFHAFLEQTFRPGFAVQGGQAGMPKKLLMGKTARIVITMGMPAPFYRWYYRAHSLKSLKCNILQFSGISPVRVTFVGGLGAGTVYGQGQPLATFERDYPFLVKARTRERWLNRLGALGAKGD
jgi:putative NADPH-quinone reductase